MTRLPSAALALGILGFASAAHADYEIDYSTQMTRSANFSMAGTSGVSERSFDCGDVYADGVVRSWYIKERNKADFRSSKHYCRDMGLDGTLVSGYVGQTHFTHSGSGTTGNSSVPLSDLPVGVRTKWKTTGTDKLVDVNMIYNSADQIASFDTGWSGAGYALSRSGTTQTLECSAGYVMTGLRILEKTTGTGGANQSEIVGVRIECSQLVEI